MRSGFTLLELLMALAIFSLIGITSVKQVQLIRDTQDTAFSDLDLYNGVRAAISVMQNDISQAFHIQFNDLGEEAAAAVRQGQAAPHTLFDGRQSEIIFTSLSHRVFYAGRRETQQAEISYYLQKKPNRELSSLMKREAALIDEDLYSGGNILTLLDDVAALRFQYWDPKSKKWLEEWNSDTGIFLDTFPLAVKVSLTVGGERGDLSVETEFKIAFPNNKEFLAEF